VSHCRDTRAYTIPGREEVLHLDGVTVFATMNPERVGGGRTKLPESIKSLFTAVKLDVPTDKELSLILLSVFKSCIQRSLVSAPAVSCIFNFHQAVCAALSRRDIGKVGGPYEFNLRDLIKTRDIVDKLMTDFVHHFNFASSAEAGPTRPPQEAAGLDKAQLCALRGVLETVYAACWQDPEEQHEVKQLFQKHVVVPMSHGAAGWTSTEDAAWSGIDVSPGSSTVRLGAVYISRGGADCGHRCIILHMVVFSCGML
jgi:hypothetical protein